MSLLDFEGLRISNQYHDWSEILNKSTFLKHVQQNRPELYDPIKKNVENRIFLYPNFSHTGRTRVISACELISPDEYIAPIVITFGKIFLTSSNVASTGGKSVEDE